MSITRRAVTSVKASAPVASSVAATRSANTPRLHRPGAAELKGFRPL